MIQRFNQAQNWQLFLLFFVLPFVGIISFYSMMFLKFDHFSKSFSSQQAIGEFYDFFRLIFIWIISIVFLIQTPLFLWQWSIGTGLQEKLPIGLNMNLRLFKGFMIYSYLFLILYILFMRWTFESMFDIPFNIGGHPNSANITDYFNRFFIIMNSMIIVLPLGLFATFCNIYNLRFCVKTLNSAELRKEAHFGDYIGDFFLMILAPIGVWFIQPRVNHIINEMPSRPNSTIPPKNPAKKSSKPTRSFSEPEENLPEIKSNGNPFEHDDDLDGLF